MSRTVSRRAAARGDFAPVPASDGTAQRAYLYVPRHGYRTDRLFVTVHGISRNAAEHARRFAPYAERHGMVLVAPLFDEARFPDYQRLGRAGRGARADLALESILDGVRDELQAPFPRCCLFGYSGGAQFAHRYALAYPERIAAYAVAAAGWYTFPDPGLRFPRGLRATARLPDLDFRLDALLDVPGLVLVGERDCKRGTALRTGPRVQVQQGGDRLSRAANWVDAMRAAALARGKPPAIEMRTLPRCGHSFRRCMERADMGAAVFDWFERQLRADAS